MRRAAYWASVVCKTVWFTRNTCCLSGSLGFRYPSGGEHQCDRAPRGPRAVSEELPSTRCVTRVPVTPLPGDSRERVPDSLCLFLCFFALCPFSVINRSCEHDCVMTYVSPSSELPTLRVVLGTPSPV